VAPEAALGPRTLGNQSRRFPPSPCRRVLLPLRGLRPAPGAPPENHI